MQWREVPDGCEGERVRLALALAGVALAAAAGPAGAAQEKPNVVVVMTDDQRLWDMEAMPITNKLIGKAGTTFDNAVATYPLCCPSRSTFLSGQYAHNHGVLDNDMPEGGYEKFDFANALGVWLQAAGYRTAHVGKMLNEYGVATSPDQDPIPPGYDEWFALRDPLTYSMYNYVVQDNSLRRPFGALPEDYQTDVLANHALEVVKEWAPEDQPFFLKLATSAIHWEFIDSENGPRPAPRHADTYADHKFEPRPSYDEVDVSDKPSIIRHYDRIDDDLGQTIAESNRVRWQALQAVDEAVGKLVAELKAAGELDNTLFIFTSDNGYLHGEHRFPSEKVVPYEESVRVPLLIRGPGFPAGVERQQMVGNIDLAPTIVELAGATPGRPMDGESLVGYAQSPTHRTTRSLVLEADFPEVHGTHFVVVPEYHRDVNVFYDGIRTTRYKYIHWFMDVNGEPADEEELYDLAADPFEMQSLHKSARHRALKRALARELSTFKDCAGDDCRRSYVAPPEPCLGTALRVTRRSLGPLGLGLHGSKLLVRAGSPRRVSGRAWRYCAGASGAAYAVFSAEGRVRLAATTGRVQGTHGIRRGSRLADLERVFPRARRLTRKLIAAGRGGLVLGLAAGKVRFVAVADRALIRNPRALTGELRRAAL